jgi:colanic acid biosynthesis glycosyl transferase WcaI
MFQPYQPRERLRDALSLPDIHIVSLDERLEGLIVPSKFVGVIAMARPVIWIGAADGEVGRLVRKSACGVIIPLGDVAALTQAIRELHEDHCAGGIRLRTMANHAQELWREQFRRRDALNAWAGMITRCASERRCI